MKHTLLLLAMSSFAVTAQNKLTATSTKHYSDAVTLDGIDSTSYSYAWNMGVLNSHSPKFAIMKDAPVYLWNYETPVLDYSSRALFGGTNYPLSQYWATNKTYNANNLCTMDEGVGNREVFTYTATNKIATHEFQQESMPGVWTTMESNSFFYDAEDRLKTVHHYDGTLGYYTNQDSLWYNGTGSTDITKLKRYESVDGVTFDIKQESQTFWTAGHPDYLYYFEDDDNDPMTPMVFMFQGNYTYPGAWCTKLEVFPIVMGFPGPVAVAQWDYLYNGSGQVTSSIESGAFGDARTDYTYQADGLLETIDSQRDEGAGMFTYQYVKFYYTDVAGIEEQVIDLTIYPNPTVDVVNFPGMMESVKVFDMNGNVVLTQTNASKIEVANLQAGQYVVITSFGDQTAKATFVKN